MRTALESMSHWARGTSLAALLVLPGTGLGALVHFALVEHTLCIEHGRLIHAPERAHDSDVETPPDSVTTGAEWSGGHSHGHCLVASCSRIGSVGPPFEVGAASALVIAVSASPCVAPSTAVSILQFAPKCSPPA